MSRRLQPLRLETSARGCCNRPHAAKAQLLEEAARLHHGARVLPSGRQGDALGLGLLLHHLVVLRDVGLTGSVVGEGAQLGLMLGSLLRRHELPAVGVLLVAGKASTSTSTSTSTNHNNLPNCLNDLCIFWAPSSDGLDDVGVSDDRDGSRCVVCCGREPCDEHARALLLRIQRLAVPLSFIVAGVGWGWLYGETTLKKEKKGKNVPYWISNSIWNVKPVFSNVGEGKSWEFFLKNITGPENNIVKKK